MVIHELSIIAPERCFVIHEQCLVIQAPCLIIRATKMAKNPKGVKSAKIFERGEIDLRRTIKFFAELPHFLLQTFLRKRRNNLERAK